MAKSPTQLSEAREKLVAPVTTATGLRKALEAVLPDYLLFEPESIWLSLDRMGIDIPLINKSKINAVIALHLCPSFYWDAIVFEKTSLSLSNAIPNANRLDEATPAQLAWAVVEAKELTQESHEFDHEPGQYAAVVLHRAGFVLAPEQLSFAQHALDALNKTHGLKTEVKDAWSKLKITANLLEHPFKETALDVQLMHLTLVQAHVEEQTLQRQRDLA